MTGVKGFPEGDGKRASGRARIWFVSSAYAFAASLAISYLFLPGITAISSGGVTFGVVFICLSVAVCYFATAVFFIAAPGSVFPGLTRRTLPERFAALPKLAAVLGIFTLGFAVLSGLLSLLVFYVLAADIQEMGRWTPVTVVVLAVLLLSLPFFARAFAGFAAGDDSLGSLFKESLRMGAPLYLKYLVLSAIAFGLAFLIRILLAGTGDPVGTLAMFILTALVFGAAIPVSWQIFRREEFQREKASEDSPPAFSDHREIA